ncbi:MAG: hypothetical protein ACI94Y_002801 [Maribacter sp.]|jgi:hypothetical protein
MKNIFFLFLAAIALSSCSMKGSCDSFNIDSFKIITGLDVPPILHVNCFEDQKYKTSAFTLDEEALSGSDRYGDIEGYADYFEFSRNRQPFIINDISTGRDINAISNSGPVYFKEGESQTYLWRAMIIPSVNELILEIERLQVIIMEKTRIIMELVMARAGIR